MTPRFHNDLRYDEHQDGRTITLTQLHSHPGNGFQAEMGRVRGNDTYLCKWHPRRHQHWRANSTSTANAFHMGVENGTVSVSSEAKTSIPVLDIY